MQRRVEQPDRHRQPRHRLEDSLEVALLERQEPVERGAAGRLVVREDHLLHDGQALLAEEHVLGATEADALRAELARSCRVGRRVGIRVYLQAAHDVGPTEDRLEVVVEPGGHERDGTENDVARCAVEGDQVALRERMASDHRDAVLEVDREVVAAGDARLAHAARDECCVRGDAAVRGEDALGGDQAVDVVRARLPADEDHVLSVVGRIPRPCPRRTRRRQTLRPARPRARWRRRRNARPGRASGAGGGRSAPDRSGRSPPRGSAVPPPPSRPRRARRPPRCAWRNGSAGGTAAPPRS